MKRCYWSLLVLLLLVCVSTSVHAQIASQSSSRVFQLPSTSRVEYSRPSFPVSSEPRILSVDTSLRSRIIANLEAVYATADPDGRHGVGGSIIAPGLGQITFAIGENFDGDAMSDSLGFEIGSNTKTFIAALILKLQEEGKLSITDSLWKWLPPFPNVDSTITIKQLLEHSSGIFDYLNDDTTGAVLRAAYIDDPEHVWTPSEILLEHVGKPNFKAGKSYSYSNTNFLLLGMIVARATGMTAAQAMHHYFLDPLAIHHVCPAWEDTEVDVMAHQWFPGGAYPSQDLSFIPKTAQLTAANTAGGVVATVTDLARWSNALYTGQLLSAASMKQMETWHTWKDGTVYGLGAMRIPYYKHSFVGHGGHLLGFSSDMATNPVDSVTFVLYTNYDVLSGDKSLNDFAVAVLDAVYAPPAAVAGDASSDLTISAWPNPATSAVAFRTPTREVLHVALYDELGRLVATGSSPVVGASVALNVSTLPAGTYYYRADCQNLRKSGSVVVLH